MMPRSTPFSRTAVILLIAFIMTIAIVPDVDAKTASAQTRREQRMQKMNDRAEARRAKRIQKEGTVPASQEVAKPVESQDIKILRNSNEMYVSYVRFGSPAYVAGLRPYNVITEIDGVKYDRYSGEEVSKLLSNPTKIVEVTVFYNKKLVVKPLGQGAVDSTATDFTVNQENDICTILIKDFGDSLSTEFRNALKKNIVLCPEGIILDLRPNAGGTQDSLVSFISLFAPKGTPLFRVSTFSSDQLITAVDGLLVPADKKMVIIAGGSAHPQIIAVASVLRARSWTKIVTDSSSFAVWGKRAFVPEVFVARIPVNDGNGTVYQILQPGHLSLWQNESVRSTPTDDLAMSKARMLLGQ